MFIIDWQSRKSDPKVFRDKPERPKFRSIWPHAKQQAMFTFDSATRGKCWQLLHERVAVFAARQVYALQCKQMPNDNAFCASVRAAR